MSWRWPPKYRKRLSLLWAPLSLLGSGLFNLYSVVRPGDPNHIARLHSLFPLAFQHWSRSITLVLGLVMVVAAPPLWRRKRRAWWLAIGLAALSVISHLLKGGGYEEAAVSALLVALLLSTRNQFTVRSREIDWSHSAWQAVTFIALACAYGISGFWLLDTREFGVNFHWYQAISSTLHFLTLQGADPALIPRTRHAVWFLDSMYLVTIAAFVGAFGSAFRPVYYRFRTHPAEIAEARTLIAAYGRCSLDHFKVWPDKSLFFGGDRRAFLAYRSHAGFAVVLGDPVGPVDSIGAVIREFHAYCTGNGWGLGFHQTLPDFLEAYRAAGFHTFKIGDEAVVDLEHFGVEGKAGKEFRSKVSQMEKLGIRTVYQESPIPPELMLQLREVSDAWLAIPGRRERQFTLGQFDETYLASTPIFYAADAAGKTLAFANIIPSPRQSETSLDLMRRREDAPNGIMDFLFVKLFLDQKARGFARFSLGMAPMSGFRPGEEARPEERAVHSFVQHLNFVFSFRGLRAFKAKFATSWEPRYAVYETPVDLARFAYALSRVSEIPER